MQTNQNFETMHARTHAPRGDNRKLYKRERRDERRAVLVAKRAYLETREV